MLHEHQTVEPKRLHYTIDIVLFWLKWVLVHSLGAAFVWVLPVLLQYFTIMCLGIGGIGTGFFVGLFLGGLEAWVLARYIQVPRINGLTFREAWTSYSCIAGGFGYLLYLSPRIMLAATSNYVPLEIIPLYYGWEIATGLLFLCILGAAQWRIIRSLGQITLLWIPVSVLAWVAGSYVGQIVSDPFFRAVSTPDPGLGMDYPLAVWVQICSATVVYGIITGTAIMLYLIRANKHNYSQT